MKDKNTDFPQFRMLSNGKSFYKINSLTHFEECQLMGSKVYYFDVKALQYPEMLKIKDLLEGVEPYVVSSETTFNQLLEKK